MARKAANVVAKKTADVVEQPKKRDPMFDIGVILHDGPPVYVRTDFARLREHIIDGIRYEHIDEDSDGCWLFRHLG